MTLGSTSSRAGRRLRSPGGSTIPAHIFHTLRRRGRHLAHGRRLLFERLEPRTLLAADLAITEFMASNQGVLLDADGDSSDWIEIHNRTTDSVDLVGWSLSDDASEPGKWHFPHAYLGPNKYLVLFASGKDRAVDSALLTRDFHATVDGTFLVDLPEGRYAVRLTAGDADKPRDAMAIHLQGMHVDTMTVDAGRFTTRTYAAEVGSESGGQLAIRLVDTGGTSSRTVINAISITSVSGGESRHYDFGNAASPVAPGYVGVTADNIYHVDAGFGWSAEAEVFDKDRGTAQDELHTHFKLNSGGEYVALYSPDGSVVSEFGAAGSDYPEQFPNISFGATAAGPRYFHPPTPGADNGPGQLGIVSDVHVSVARGFFDAPLEVEMSTSMHGAVIRYTVDASTPTETHGTVYSEPLPISTTTTLRVAAFQDDFVPSDVETHTYLFVGDVAQQGNNPPEYPRTWVSNAGSGSLPGDYEMDPEITQHPAYADLVDDSLRSLPTISIVTDIDNLFDRSRGIYMQPERHGVQWERRASVELILPDGSEGFQEDAGLRIQGGASRLPTKSPKHSFRLLFKGIYAAPTLKYPLFGADATDEFDTIILRAGFNQSWIHHNTFLGDNRGRAQFVRDQWAKDTQLAMGHVAAHNSYAHLYLNGLYWGLYNPTERPSGSFGAAYLGGDKDDYDVINSEELVAGTAEAWQRLKQFTDLTIDATNYQEVSALLDIDGFIDYMILNHYGGNLDWDNHNWYALGRRDEDAKFRFFAWDSEFFFNGLQDQKVSSRSGTPGQLLANLMKFAPFRQEFTAHAERHLFGTGLLTPASVVRRWEARSAEVFDALIAESARWGDYRRDVHKSGTPLELLERDVQWLAERNRLRTEYFPFRTDVVIQQYRDAGWLPATDPPDPVLSDLPLRISEIHYEPHDANPVPGLAERSVAGDRFEFIELLNVGEHPIDLDGVQLAETRVDGDMQGVVFTFAQQWLDPGQRLVAVRDRQAFQSRYGSDARIALGGDDGQYEGKLSNRGERITLLDSAGQRITQVDYGTTAPWPRRAAGQGSSLTLIDPWAVPGDPANWRASTELGGSPGRVEPAREFGVHIHEVLAHPSAAHHDWLELHNPTDQPIDINRWWLGQLPDDDFSFQVTVPTVIPPGGYLVLSEAELGLDIDHRGERRLRLIETDVSGRPVRFADEVGVPPSDVGISVGRAPDGGSSAGLFPMSEPTPGASNAAAERRGPIISEVHYSAPTHQFRADFEQGDAGLTPVLGAWNVTDAGHYEVIPGAEADTIAVLSDFGPPGNARLHVTFQIRDDERFWKNAALIFDYHGPTDFKFVSAHTRASRIRIGYRDETGWHVLQDAAKSFPTDTESSLTVFITGSKVSVRTSRDKRMIQDFGELVGDGLLAIGSKNAHVDFVHVEANSLDEPEVDEFVELHNPLPDPIDVSGWQLTGGMELDLPAETVMGPGETVVLVGFSPTDEARETNFRQRMGVDRSVRLLGPYSGALSDVGGSVQLLRPLADRSAWALVDRVAYNVRAPWPADVRATGTSLQRRGPDAFGDAPQSWLAADPTPGSVQFTPLGDMDLSGRVDAEDINGFVLALMRPQEYEADFGVPAIFAGDLDQDGDVDFDDIDDFLARLSEPSGLTGELSRTGARVTPTERSHRAPLSAKERNL